MKTDQSRCTILVPMTKDESQVYNRDGKEPSQLEFGSVPNIQGSFGSGSFQLRKNESSFGVQFFVQSLRFCSVRYCAGSQMNIY